MRYCALSCGTICSTLSINVAKFILNSIPYSLQIDLKVSVYEPIAHPDDLGPGNVWLVLLSLSTHACRSFTNNLNCLQNRVLV